MKFSNTNIKGIVVIEPKLIKDKRGYFLESFNKNKFKSEIGEVTFVQENESKSYKGVLRGLHYQKPPFAQAKLVRCIEGEILDVALDLRKGSNTYGLYHSVILSKENKKQLFIPRGFAHGFLVLSDIAVFSYKVDNFYSLEHDAGIRWNDKKLNIQWGLEMSDILVSEKDSKHPFFSQFNSPFKL
tara:strand:+ start:350 stop:904 length:555 start_codon:yes stop_codon:yes gene_type:complete